MFLEEIHYLEEVLPLLTRIYIIQYTNLIILKIFKIQTLQIMIN